MNPFGYKNIPQLAEIQSRLAYVSSVKQLEDVKNLEGCYYVRPEVTKYGTLEFEKAHDIFQAGYETGKSLVEAWRAEGTLATLFNLVDDTPTVPGFNLRRRASI
jgi:lysophospholipid hydrolase